MTATLTLPLVAWGTADDLSASPYASLNTPTVTSGVTDPFGGTGAYTIDDNDAGNAEARRRDLALATDGSHVYAFWAKQGTASASDVQLYDNTAGATRCQVRLTWSGGVPTTSVVSGSGTIYTVDCGNSWYLVLVLYGSVVAANTNRVYFYGATSTAASTGTTSYYVRNVVLLSYLDGATTWPEPRNGSAWAEAPSGTEDAWIVGTNWHLAGTVRHIPDTPTDSPETVSGWYGANEATGVNCGVAAMLSAGRDKQTLRWVKDRADCATYVDGYLVEPMRGRPELEPNWRRTFPLELRSSSVFAGY